MGIKAAWWALLVVTSAFNCAGQSLANDNPVATPSAETMAIPLASPMLVSALMAPDPPLGFVSFCLRFKDQCIVPDGDPEQVKLSSTVWSEIYGVNRTVNHLIKPMSDRKHYGLAEFWTLPRDGFGDCEDYALAKQAVLFSLGLPRSALRIAVVKTLEGEGHAVLTISTDRGDYVLDNMTDAVRGWEDAGYDWVERQDSRSKSGWVLLQHPEIDVRTAYTPPAPTRPYRRR